MLINSLRKAEPFNFGRKPLTKKKLKMVVKNCRMKNNSFKRLLEKFLKNALKKKLTVNWSIKR